MRTSAFASSDQIRHAPVRQAKAQPAFADNRPAAAAQRKLAELANNGPLAMQQKAAMDAVQRKTEEEPMQGKFEAVQRAEAEKLEEEKPLQGKFSSDMPAQLEPQSAARSNNTGLPDNLKSGIESLSGMSMDGVKVHYNSPQPAQLNAHAYAQGSDIHVAPGQERHLPHEAWHVVQQAQGRVQATMQMKDGVPVNDDAGLEHEADVMGARAVGANHATLSLKAAPDAGGSLLQLKSEVHMQEQTLSGEDDNSVDQEQTAGKLMTAELDPMYPLKGSKPGAGAVYAMYGALNRDWHDPFIKGHLLNDNLGGLGIVENLFPITAEANKAHLNRVEQHVKNALITMHEGIVADPTKVGSYVAYSVEADPDDQNDFMQDPDTSLICNAATHYVGGSGTTITPIIEETVIRSETGGADNSGHNAELARIGWGSFGSGRRSKAADDAGPVGYKKDGTYYHMEFEDPATNQYVKWTYNSGTATWKKSASEDQTPIHLREES